MSSPLSDFGAVKQERVALEKSLKTGTGMPELKEDVAGNEDSHALKEEFTMLPFPIISMSISRLEVVFSKE